MSEDIMMQNNLRVPTINTRVLPEKGLYNNSFTGDTELSIISILLKTKPIICFFRFLRCTDDYYKCNEPI